jgi:hypothetical protein
MVCATDAREQGQRSPPARTKEGAIRGDPPVRSCGALPVGGPWLRSRSSAHLLLHKAPWWGAIRIFLLDDHELVRREIRDLLWSEQDITVVGHASNAAQALDLQ